MELLELEGIKYNGRFEGELVEGRETFSNCEAPDFGYEVITHHYEGFGKIERTTGFPDGGEFLFKFRTNSRRVGGLKNLIDSLIGGSFSYISLDDITGREAFLHCIYQYLKRENAKNPRTIIPPLIHCRSISHIEVGNVRAQLNEAFSY